MKDKKHINNQLYNKISNERTVVNMKIEIIDLLKDYLHIKDHEKEYLQDIERDVNTLTENIINNISKFMIEDNTIKDNWWILELTQRNSISAWRWLLWKEIRETANIIYDTLNQNITIFQGKKINSYKYKYLTSLEKKHNISNINETFSSHPLLLNHLKEIVTYINRDIKYIKFLGKWGSWIIVDIWSKVVKFDMFSTWTYEKEANNQILFYSALEKEHLHGNCKNIIIPEVKWYERNKIEMQKIDGKTLLYYWIISFFKEDLSNIKNFIYEHRRETTINYLYNSVVNESNLHTDKQLLKHFTENDIIALLQYRHQVGLLQTPLKNKSIEEIIVNIKTSKKKDLINNIVYLFKEELKDDIMWICKSIDSFEQNMQKYGLIHTDFHNWNIMLEGTNWKKIKIGIIDFGNVEVNHALNYIAMNIIS